MWLCFLGNSPSFSCVYDPQTRESQLVDLGNPPQLTLTGQGTSHLFNLYKLMGLKVRIKEPAANQKSVFVQSKLIRIHLLSFSGGDRRFLLPPLFPLVPSCRSQEQSPSLSLYSNWNISPSWMPDFLSLVCLFIYFYCLKAFWCTIQKQGFRCNHNPFSSFERFFFLTLWTINTQF